MKPSELYKTKKWIRGYSAIDKNGGLISVKSRNAIGFCLIGAIERCAKSGKQASKWRNLLLPYVYRDIAHHNDWILKNKKEAVALLKKTGL